MGGGADEEGVIDCHIVHTRGAEMGKQPVGQFLLMSMAAIDGM